MAKMLLSIKPEYVNKIFKGEKEYEFRKRIARESIDKIVIYATAPVKKIVGEVTVLECLEMSPEKLWQYTQNKAGISKEKYDSYFQKSSTAYAYKLANVIQYSRAYELSRLGIKFVPQSFVYISEKQYEILTRE